MGRNAGYKLLIVDELGYVPLSATHAELLFEVFSQRYERGSIVATSNLPCGRWTSVFGSERLTGALLDRPTHHVHILEMNGDSFRFKQSKRQVKNDQPQQHIKSRDLGTCRRFVPLGFSRGENLDTTKDTNIGTLRILHRKERDFGRKGHYFAPPSGHLGPRLLISFRMRPYQ